ncbi:MAG: CRTAC1 family protein [Alphaproteobacteria bacterium]|nr:CRTAC1 family protein [Alphaproteobacteria bacterium]
MPMLLIALLLPSCTHKDAAVDSTGLPPVCNAGSVWTPGTTAFRDASADWGITDLMPVGVRVDAVDFDGDGWTDLAVRSGWDGDDFNGGNRSTWLLRNTGEGRFEDVTQSSGVVVGRDGDTSAGRAGPVWVFADVDNDGDLDLYTGLPDADNNFSETSEIRLNNGDGTFSLADGGDARVERSDTPYGAAFADVDRDGNVDLWTGQYGAIQDLLFAGDGAGGFTEVTGERGLTTRRWAQLSDLNQGLAHSNAWSAAACDLNNDGAPELLASSYGRAPNHLWLNDGAGSFTNVSVDSNYAFDHRTDWSDNESARCWCTLHPTDADCAGVPAPERIACSSDGDAFRWDHTYDREPFRLGGNSGATVCRDVDNDGWVDLLTTEIVHWDVGTSSDPSELLFNTQDPNVVFERPGNEVTGLTREHDRTDWNDGDITGSIFDFDNDGWPDVWIGSSDYAGTRGLLFHQTAPRQFEAVPPADGVDHTRSHGSAIADFDRDGDLDIVVGHSTARCSDDCRDTFEVRLFENLMGEDSNFLQLHLVGTGGSNAAAVGARVEVTADGVTQVQHVTGGFGQWGNQDDLTLHFGLGGACEADVTVTWPDADGTTETFALGGGYRYVVTQGAGAVGEM